MARIVMGLLMVLYLLVVIESHSVPLSPALEFPLPLAGWLAIVVVLLLGARRGTVVIDFSNIGWRWIPHLAFAAAAVVGFYFAFTGNLSLACPQQATSCVKIDHWRMSGSHYYRQFPYDSQGNDDPGAPWVEISRPEYVAEVGTRLRSAAQFGLGALSAAWVLSGALGAIRRD